jgi:hypothetical protein
VYPLWNFCLLSSGFVSDWDLDSLQSREVHFHMNYKRLVTSVRHLQTDKFLSCLCFRSAGRQGSYWLRNTGRINMAVQVTAVQRRNSILFASQREAGCHLVSSTSLDRSQTHAKHNSHILVLHTPTRSMLHSPVAVQYLHTASKPSRVLQYGKTMDWTELLSWDMKLDLSRRNTD